MHLRQLLNHQTACASNLLGGRPHGAFALVDPHVDLVDQYAAPAASQGAAIVAVLDTRVQADHVSVLPPVARAAGTAHLPEDAGAGLEHRALRDGAVVGLGNTEIVGIVAANRGARPLAEVA